DRRLRVRHVWLGHRPRGKQGRIVATTCRSMKRAHAHCAVRGLPLRCSRAATAFGIRRRLSTTKRMPRLVSCSAVLWIMLAAISPARAQQAPREKLLMDFGWKFHLGNEWGTGEAPINVAVSTGPARQEFDDSSWPTIDLPHDWAVALPFDS